MNYACTNDDCAFVTDIETTYCCGACGQADLVGKKIGDESHIDHSPYCGRKVFVPEPEDVIEQEAAEEVPEDLTGGLTGAELEAGYAIKVSIVHLETNTIVGEAISRGVSPDLFVPGPGNYAEGWNAYENLVSKVAAQAYGKAFAKND